MKNKAGEDGVGVNGTNITGSILLVTLISLLVFGSTDIEKLSDASGEG